MEKLSLDTHAGERAGESEHTPPHEQRSADDADYMQQATRRYLVRGILPGEQARALSMCCGIVVACVRVSIVTYVEKRDRPTSGSRARSTLH